MDSLQRLAAPTTVVQTAANALIRALTVVLMAIAPVMLLVASPAKTAASAPVLALPVTPPLVSANQITVATLVRRTMIATQNALIATLSASASQTPLRFATSSAITTTNAHLTLAASVMAFANPESLVARLAS